MKQFNTVAAMTIAMLASAGCSHMAGTRPADACGLARIAPGQQVLQVPIELIDGRVYVQVMVNGRGPFRFAVDTGASGMARADASLVAALQLPLSGQQLNSDGVRVASADTTRLASLELGGLVQRDVEVIARDYSSRKPAGQRFSGIIGREFFGDGLLVIDYPGKTLVYSTKAGIAADARNGMGYERAFRVPVSIGGVQTTGQLDTGANVTAVLPASLYQRVSATPLQAATNGQLGNGDIETSRATVAGPVRIGGASLSNLEVRVSAEFPELLIGAHVLQRYVLAIDQRSQRVALCEPGRN